MTINHPSFSTSFDLGPAIGLDVDTVVDSATMHRALLACGWDDPEPDFVDACVGAAERGVDALAEVVVGNASLGEARETAEEIFAALDRG